MHFRSPEEFLGHVLRGISPYLDTLVLVGGFAVWLCRFHPRAAQTEIVPLRTFAVDLAAPPEVRSMAGRSLSDLVAAAGLQPTFFGDQIPPVMKFFPVRESTSPRDNPADQYCVEFFTPLTGRTAGRAGRVSPTKEIQKGITAQRLRYLHLLMVDPWRVSLKVLPGMKGKADERIRVKVPHPGLFVAHKILISDEAGRREKRGKDMAFLYEVLALFRRDIPLLAQEVREIAGKSPVWRRWLKRFRQRAAELFETPSSAGVTEAYEVFASAAAGGETPTPFMIHAGVQAFLRHF